jgi:putative glutamine amidotransferase
MKIIRPIITVSLGEREISDGPNLWGDHKTYFSCIIDSGGTPLAVPPVTDNSLLRHYYELSDGILIPGGDDVDPREYGEERVVECGPSDLRKDFVERTLINWAREDRKPILGLCRGSQILNVVYGGSLFQDLPSQRKSDLPHKSVPNKWFESLHSIRIVEDSRLGQLLQTSEIGVNSLHHQAVKSVGAGLRAVAFAPDGVVEAVESELLDHFAIGIQCHPESMYTEAEPRFRRLFQAFIEAAGAFKGLRSSISTIE